jgi:hypothetical protein
MGLSEASHGGSGGTGPQEKKAMSLIDGARAKRATGGLGGLAPRKEGNEFD